MKIMLVYPNLVRARTPQMGILTIGSYLMNKGIDAVVCDLTFTASRRYLNHLLSDIERNNPDIIGFSCRTMEFPLSRELLVEVRNRYGNKILLIAGGPHVTFAPEELAPYVDYSVVGEGELVAAEIVDLLANDRKSSIDEIQNVAYLKEGELVQNPLRPLLDLSEQPIPRYELFDERHYYSNNYLNNIPGTTVCGTFEGSRGCPYVCTYCSNKTLMDIYRGGGKWRREKPAFLLRKEIDAFKDIYGLDMMYFVDEVMMTTDSRTLELRNHLHDLNTPFLCMEFPELVREERVKHMKDAGLYSCAIGIESGNHEYRKDVLDRRTSDEKIYRAFELMKKHGVKTHAFTMAGLPGQTKEMMRETYDVLKDVQPDSAQASTFFPLPGTYLSNLLKAEGMLDDGFYPTSYYTTSVLKYTVEHKKYIDNISRMINLGLWKKSKINDMVEKVCFKMPIMTVIVSKLSRLLVLCNYIKRYGIFATVKKIKSKIDQGTLNPLAA